MFFNKYKQLTGCFIYIFMVAASVHVLPVELAIPGPMPKPLPIPAPTEALQVKAPPMEISAPVTPPRSPRKLKMDQVLSGFKRGFQLSEKRRLVDFIFEESRRYGFDPELILALISTESSFNHRAVSARGAMGLMQIIPSTGKAIAKAKQITWQEEKEPLFDPFVNVRLGIHYLHSLKERFQDIHIALAAYNYGPTKIRRRMRQGRKIPRRYANKVMLAYKSYLSLNTQVLNAT